METPKTTPQPRWRLSEERNRRKWSQQEVADRIGTTYVNISRWERGITRPNPYFRRQLCTLFGKSAAALDLEYSMERSRKDGENVESSSASPITSHTLDNAPPAEKASGTAIIDYAIPLKPAIRLVGRENQLGQIKKRLVNGGSVALTALNGLPGVGKTALSITLAHDPEIRAHFRDGILWAGLGPLPTISGLLSRWGTLLGISTSTITAQNSTEEWASTLHSAIGSRAMLLVIDDAWQLEDALALKVGGSHCAHLITTRFPHIATHMTVDGATVIHELNEIESMELLRRLAPEAVDSEAQKAAVLVHAVGGLPLALTLMGNYLRKEAISGKPRRIGAALERLTIAEERLQIHEPHGPVESHTSLSLNTQLSLQSVFAVTDQRLEKSTRAALYALSVFPPKPNSFSEEAALAVAACTEQTLDSLTDTGLLESVGSDRYTLHQTIADYAQLQLKEPAAARDRLIAFVISYVEAHEKDYELLEIESNTILAALVFAYETGRQAELVRAVNTFAQFLLLRGLYPSAEEQLQRARKAAQAIDDSHGLATTLLHLGEIAQKLSKYPQAQEYYNEGLSLARQVQDPERISALLMNLGWLTSKLGAYTQAETYLQEGLILARQINHLESISDLLETLGSVAWNRGGYEQSETYIQEALDIARQLGDRERICKMLINLGSTTGEQGNHVQEIAYYQEGLTIARQIGHREWISLLLINLGNVVAEQGDYLLAEEYLQEGLMLARQIGHREWISVLLVNLGLTARKQGNYAKAEAYLQESLTLTRQIGISQITANGLYEYGNLQLDQQHFEAASATFQDMLDTIPDGNQYLVALAQYGLARATAAQGNIQEAQKLGEISVATLEATRNRKANEVREWLDSIVD
jgi:tetratricopeptide (TPR) repeat protein/transcriptional regulator with XRE-family HTH domain